MQFDTTVPTNSLSPENFPDIASIPKHVAIIMDGNRRWAKQRNLSPVLGHWEGAEVLTEIVNFASLLGIQTLTVYAFSTENWHRADAEVQDLMHLFEMYLKTKKNLMIQNGIRLDAIGDLNKLPKDVLSTFYETKNATSICNKINLVLALNYGGRDELRRALEKIARDVKSNLTQPQDITENMISSYLDTAPWGDPEFIIRTSGELRISNFLLWQASYAELYVTDTLWPDFSTQDFLQAILIYQERFRRIRGGR